MAYFLLQFDSLALPLLEAMVVVPTVAGVAGRIRTTAGEYDAWGSGQADPEFPQEIQFRGRVVNSAGDTAYMAAVDALRALGRRKAYLYRAGQDSIVQRALARCTGVSGLDNTEAFADTELTLTFELWSHWENHWQRTWVLDAGYYLDTGLFFDATAFVTTLTTSPQTISVTNGGNVAVDDAILTIYAGSSAITALTIACGSAKWTYTGAIASGKNLVVDAGAWTVKNDGADAYAGFAFDSTHALNGIFRLAPGANSVVVTRTGGGTGSTFTIEFGDAWA